ncbi:MAG: class I SAM-dependent methyltransferase [Parvibaculales bacterium]
MPSHTELAQKLITHIHANGPLTIDDYMAQALGDVEHGYYMKQDPFGVAGDFITAPEVSQVFGEMLGLWAADFALRNQFEKLTLAELGPGRGTLMQDILRVLTKTHATQKLVQATQIHLVETSPILKQKQADTLAEYHSQITWHDTIASLPETPMIIFANEFFDALPIKQFVQTQKGLEERMIDVEQDKFIYCHAPTQAAENFANNAKPPTLAIGDIVEYSPASLSIMKDLSARIASRRGAMIVLDYGYLTPMAGDSFQALYRHEYVHPLNHIGDADLTAHVNFAALSQAAQLAGAKCVGPTTQARFLKNIGIEARFAQLLQSAPAQAQNLTAARQRLLAPELMGHLFKALAVYHTNSAAPAGFHENGQEEL